MLGKLTWSAIPFAEPLPLITSAVVLAVIGGVLAWITAKGHWGYLWREWITSVDHKRVGIMYFLLGLIMLLRGFSDALLMRTHLAMATGVNQGYLPPEHFNQIFSAHGTIMIFFVAMPLVMGLMNFVLPLQLGVRDVAFPTMNSISFWLTASGALLINVSLFIGEFARTGWLAYPPLSELQFSPGVGVDYYLWSVQISGVGTLLSAVNLVTTILKMRAPGMSYTRMPVFCWTALASNLVILAIFPILTACLAMLTLDRYLGFHFFTTDGGGSAMMFVNLIWMWGHPEVYALALPAYGVYSEVVSTFSSKPLFGYRSMVSASMAICVLSCMVWLHHFFTMGAGADVNAFFGIATMIIAVPTGVKLFNWLFTMYGGRVRFEVPMLWTLGFMITFVTGGLTGVLLAVPPVDFIVHNSQFLVAHFHHVIISGVVFGLFAGYTYWFPKAFGFRLHDGWGKAAFWCWFFGFYLAWMPMYVIGMQGATRRMQHYNDPSWQPYEIVAACGALLILCGVLCQATQLIVSIRNRDKLRDVTGDPWDGRSLEWSTTSPPPAFNFAVLPDVRGEEAYWGVKQRAIAQLQLDEAPAYQPIELPRATPIGVITAFFVSFAGFGMVWHIWWLVAASVAAGFVALATFGWRREDEFEIPAAEVARLDQDRRAIRTGALADVAPDRQEAAHAALALEVTDPHQLGHAGADTKPGVRDNGPASKTVVAGFGFWVFLLTDIVMFSALFATYAVLANATDGGPTSKMLFSRTTVGIETVCLLFSTFTCGLAFLAAKRRNVGVTQLMLALTGVLGAAFLSIELREFASMIAQGAGPSRSAFLSAFFTLVGCHGIHVAAGLVWLVSLAAQIATRGFEPKVQRKLLCFSLFWHALDIVWVAVFTIVYLFGTSL
ncbi:cytochrome o ubiquinol oxidase subunit I [Sphingomonas elodea]|uniref:cytochrome o ubiquinol oxidase subunit I n=1 Tax=Sphingomonas trueperi TaxID=53317 RepID=UPI000F26736F